MTTSSPETVTLPVLGMTCAACQHHVESALRSTAGVQSAHVDLMAHRATVVFDPLRADPPSLVEAIRGAGYDAVLAAPGDPPSHADFGGKQDLKAWLTIAAGVISIPANAA